MDVLSGGMFGSILGATAPNAPGGTGPAAGKMVGGTSTPSNDGGAFRGGMRRQDSTGSGDIASEGGGNTGGWGGGGGTAAGRGPESKDADKDVRYCVVLSNGGPPPPPARCDNPGLVRNELTRCVGLHCSFSPPHNPPASLRRVVLNAREPLYVCCVCCSVARRQASRGGGGGAGGLAAKGVAGRHSGETPMTGGKSSLARDVTMGGRGG